MRPDRKKSLKDCGCEQGQSARLTNKSSPGRWVVSLSSKCLLSEEISVLEKGLNFDPAPQRVPYKEIIAAVEKSFAT